MFTTKVISMALAVAGALAGVAGIAAEPSQPVAYPRHFRRWAHVKSALVGPQSPFYGRVGGLHHIYANAKAVAGYQTGRFPNGSVLVFDVLETNEMQGITLEGPRRFIDVMEKDDQRFAATGGWGYEEFQRDSRTERALTLKGAQECHNCHTGAKDHGFVFSRLRP